MGLQSGFWLHWNNSELSLWVVEFTHDKKVNKVLLCLYEDDAMSWQFYGRSIELITTIYFGRRMTVEEGVSIRR